MNNNRERINELIALAEKGDAVAQNFLGAALCTGSNVKKDIVGGFYWYCKSIEQGFVEAKWNAGSILVDGEGLIEKNLELGLILIKEAADAGEPGACSFMRDCYEFGSYGFFVDKKLSLFWSNCINNLEQKTFDSPKKMFNKYIFNIEKPSVIFVEK